MSTTTPLLELDVVTIRFAGDSGDGMQLTGTKFSDTIALVGNDIATFPDYPAEIRAPAGSPAGVSAFQVCLGSRKVYTPGDKPDILVAMNPAALKICLKDMAAGDTLVLNSEAFTPSNLKKANYATNPLEDGSLDKYLVYKFPVDSLNARAVESAGLGAKDADRCKNFFVLGIIFHLFDKPLVPTEKWISDKFKKNASLVQANIATLRAGYNYAETAAIFQARYAIKPTKIKPGKYRTITGNEATALGLIAAAELAQTPLFYGSYPITPASEILHTLAKYKNFGVKTFQAEDEIAAIGATLGAAYAGNIAVTGTSGPGTALKTEIIGLAVMTELPMVIINVQRGGPSTGLPTKTEQSDLFQAMFARNGECPLVVLAAATPGDCFLMAIEAVRLAVKYMTPVFLLSDGYLANGAEPFRIPDLTEFPKIEVKYATDPEGFFPYKRNENLVRPWAIPGAPGLEHRVGGLEKDTLTGMVSYDPDNHEKMCHFRANKIAKVVADVPDVEVFGEKSGKVLVVGWGGTYGSITSAVEDLQGRGKSVSSIHLRHINPFPKNLGDVLRNFETVVAPELNLGQLAFLLRGCYLVDVQSITKMKGRPFGFKELAQKIEAYL